MPITIQQRIIFKNTRPSKLYQFYTESKKHSATTGAPAKIQPRAGKRFKAHDGYIKGRNFQLIKNEQVVQSWRGKDWSADENDSILILSFSQDGKDTIVEMIHARVPERHAEGIKSGWYTHYWDRWKKFLSDQEKKRKKK
jgi:activator of HSP90 ATPase